MYSSSIHSPNGLPPLFLVLSPDMSSPSLLLDDNASSVAKTGTWTSASLRVLTGIISKMCLEDLPPHNGAGVIAGKGCPLRGRGSGRGSIAIFSTTTKSFKFGFTMGLGL